MQTRSFPLLFGLLVAALSVPGGNANAAPTDSVVLTAAAIEPAPVLRHQLTISADSVYLRTMPPLVLRAADTRHQAPPARSPLPLSLLGFAAAGATSRSKRPTRRVRKDIKVPDVPLFLDSDVHVMRDGELTTIRGGVLVEDTELEDEEVEELIKHGVVRPAKHDELQTLEAAGSMTAAEDLAREQAQEVAALQTSHDAALAEADASGTLSPAKREKLVAKQAEERTALQEQHTAALNKLSA